MSDAIEKVKLARGRYRIVMMSCGYVESNTTSWLIFSTHEGVFVTAAEATMELALDLFAKYEEDVMSMQYVYHKDCCKAEIAKSLEAEYCSKCGTRVKAKEFDPEEFMQYVKGLHRTDCDGYGEAEATANRSFAFWPFRADDILGAEKDEVVFIAENGEVVMLNALYESREDLRVLDEGFVPNDSDGEWRCSDWKDVRSKGTNSSY